MQAFILDRFVTKAFEFFFEMQHATLEISDHQVSRIEETEALRATSFSNA